MKAIERKKVFEIIGSGKWNPKALQREKTKK